MLVLAYVLFGGPVKGASADLKPEPEGHRDAA